MENILDDNIESEIEIEYFDIEKVIEDVCQSFLIDTKGLVLSYFISHEVS